MIEYPDKKIVVDAIEEGKIVRVTEDYAIREGLPILRRKEISFFGSPDRRAARELEKREVKRVSVFDMFRRPLHQKSNDVAASLIDNFHWVISKKRREMNITRKQLADKMGVSELDIKMIENGVLPSDDYVLINKIQQLFRINLRKDGKDFNAPFSSKLSSAAPQAADSAKKSPEKFEIPKEHKEDVLPISEQELEIDLDED
jgi:ribosome-binding protein aMBF1 (putative translation factor)